MIAYFLAAQTSIDMGRISSRWDYIHAYTQCTVDRATVIAREEVGAHPSRPEVSIAYEAMSQCWKLQASYEALIPKANAQVSDSDIQYGADVERSVFQAARAAALQELVTTPAR